MRRSDASGCDYVLLSLAAPEFGPRHFYANLAQSADERDVRFVLLWMRRADWVPARPRRRAQISSG
jgi:uncharacterized protein (DUF736 family)